MTRTEEPEGASYRRPPVWPRPGAPLESAAAVAVVLSWLMDNREYLLGVIERLMYRGERGRCEWEPADVVARLALRARRKSGLVRSLKAHADGSQPIDDPRKILLKHAGWMVQEFRREQRTKTHEVPASDSGVLEIAVEDADADPRYGELIVDLGNDAQSTFEFHCQGRPNDKAAWARYVNARLPALQKLFDVAAPPQLRGELLLMTRDDRACVLLGVFPLRMSSSAVATYRGAQGATTSTTEDATRQRIARLRYRLASVWPGSSAAERISMDPRRETHRGEGRHGVS